MELPKTLLTMQGDRLASELTLSQPSECRTTSIGKQFAFSPSCLNSLGVLRSPLVSGLLAIDIELFLDSSELSQEGWYGYTSRWVRGGMTPIFVTTMGLPKSTWTTVTLWLRDAGPDFGEFVLAFGPGGPINEDQFVHTHKSYASGAHQELRRNLLGSQARYLSEMTNLWLKSVKLRPVSTTVPDEQFKDPMPEVAKTLNHFGVGGFCVWFLLVFLARRRLSLAVVAVTLLYPLLALIYVSYFDSRAMLYLFELGLGWVKDELNSQWEWVAAQQKVANRDSVVKILQDMDNIRPELNFVLGDKHESLRKELGQYIVSAHEMQAESLVAAVDKLLPKYCQSQALVDARFGKRSNYVATACIHQSEYSKNLKAALGVRDVQAIEELVNLARFATPASEVLMRLHLDHDYSLTILGASTWIARDRAMTPSGQKALMPLLMMAGALQCQIRQPAGSKFSDCSGWQAFSKVGEWLGSGQSIGQELHTFLNSPDLSTQIFESQQSLDNNARAWSIFPFEGEILVLELRYSRGMVMPKLSDRLASLKPDLEYFLLPAGWHEPWPYERIHQGHFYEVAALTAQSQQSTYLRTRDGDSEYLYLGRPFTPWLPNVLVIRCNIDSFVYLMNFVRVAIPLLLLLSLLVSLAISTWIGRHIFRPLKSILLAFRRISSGDYHQDVSIQGKGEVALAGQGLQEILEGLRDKSAIEGFLNGLVSGSNSAETTQRLECIVVFAGFRDPDSVLVRFADRDLVEFHNQFLILTQSTFAQYGFRIDKFTNHDCLALAKTPVSPEILYGLSHTLSIRFRGFLQSYSGLTLGAGLSLGEVVVGQVGSRARMDYTCIGDTVNLAARLCAMAQGPEPTIITHESLVERAGLSEARFLQELTIRGKSERVKVYQL